MIIGLSKITNPRTLFTIVRRGVLTSVRAFGVITLITAFALSPLAPLAGLSTQATHAAGGAGTSGSPYIIETAQEFEAIASYPNAANGLYFRLANDITLANTYQSIPEFSGTLDGAGRTINGLEVALFEELEGADVRNLTLEGDVVDTDGDYGAAMLALMVYDSSIENVLVSGSIAVIGFEPGTCSEVGGLVGYSSDSTYNHVTANVAIEAPDCDSVGGLIGYSQSEKISNATATGTVSGLYGVGGLIGRTLGGSSPSDDTGIFGAEATGAVTGEDDVGGLIGENVRTHVTGATARGAVTGNDNVGGLIGTVNSDSFRYQEISRVRALGAVTGEDNVGGLIGRASTNQNTGIALSIAYADNDVSGVNNAGGLIGYTKSASYANNSSWFLIEDTYSWGNVAASGSNAGGLIGTMTAEGTEEAITGIANSYAWNKGSGTGVTAQTNAGGLVGRIASPETWPPEDPYISEAYRLYGSFAQTPISASGDTAGGIVGALETGGDEFSPGTDEWKNYFNAHTGDLDCDPGLKFSCEMVYDSTYFFNSQLDEPMSNWDFEGIWLVQANTPPVFQAQFAEAGFGPEENDYDGGDNGGGSSLSFSNPVNKTVPTEQDLNIIDLQIVGDGEEDEVLNINLYVSGGSLEFGVTTGLTFVGSQQGQNLQFSGTRADINAALESLVFSAPDTVGTYTVEALINGEGGGVVWSENGHAYKVVSPNGGITWADARTAAENQTFGGVSGYLATITSEEEHNFILTRIDQSGWIGATDSSALYDDALEGEWYWATGPEEGTHFWTGGQNGSAVGDEFANWSNIGTQEPNNAGGNEHCAQIRFRLDTEPYIYGLWNDSTCTTLLVNYVVEFGGFLDENDDPILPEVVSTSFTITVTGAADLVVSNFTPAHEATNVSVNTTTLSFTFSEPVTLDAATAYLRLYANDEEVQEFWVEDNTIRLSEDGLTVTFHLEEPLLPNTRYYVEIDDDFAYVTANDDQVFGGLWGNAFWSFTTAPASGGNSGGGSSSGSSRGGGTRTPAPVVTPTTPTAVPTSIQNIITQNRDIFVNAHNAGIVLPAFILNLLGIDAAPAGGLCPQYTFTRDLRFGDQGEDVRALQKFFNCAGFALGTSGPGAPGEETIYFVERTRNSLIRFQEAYAAEVLAPINATKGTGIFSTYSRAKVRGLMVQ